MKWKTEEYERLQQEKIEAQEMLEKRLAEMVVKRKAEIEEERRKAEEELQLMFSSTLLKRTKLFSLILEVSISTFSNLQKLWKEIKFYR